MSGKTIIVVAGPESSSTHLWEWAMSVHPDVYGVGHFGDRDDPMESVWCATNFGVGEPVVPDCEEPFIVTRRSLPHGMSGLSAKAKAKFMRFLSFDEFHDECVRQGHRVVYLLTTRAVTANVESCRRERSSSKQTGRKLCCVIEQYRSANELLFDFFSRRGVAWWMVSMEALVMGHPLYLRSIYHLLGLAPVNVDVNLRDSNTKRFEEFLHLELEERDRYREWSFGEGGEQ